MMDNTNKEINDIKENENIIESKENTSKINSEFNEEINKDSYNENLIGNNQFLINKLKEEHKIGFKSKKNEDNKEQQITEENNEMEAKSDINKDNEFSFNNFQIKSKSLKDMLKQNDE